MPEPRKQILEDWLAEVIDDSLDVDWTGRVGAAAIVSRIREMPEETIYWNSLLSQYAIKP